MWCNIGLLKKKRYAIVIIRKIRFDDECACSTLWLRNIRKMYAVSHLTHSIKCYEPVIEILWQFSLIIALVMILVLTWDRYHAHATAAQL